MNAILQLDKNKRGILRRVFTPPLSTEVFTKNNCSIALCTLNPLWKPRFAKMIQSLCANYDTVWFDESMKACPKLYEKPSTTPVFCRRLKEILGLIPESNLQAPVVVCERPDERISTVLEALSKHAKVVTIVTDDNGFFDEIAKDSMLFFGLSLNQRTQPCLSATDLAILLSSQGETELLANRIISLCETNFICDAHVLEDFSSQTTSDFFSAFPKIRMKHCFLVSEKEPIRNLIWKISKKS